MLKIFTNCIMVTTMDKEFEVNNQELTEEIKICEAEIGIWCRREEDNNTNIDRLKMIEVTGREVDHLVKEVLLSQGQEIGK